MKPSVFIDSNVWFSAFYKSGSCSTIHQEVNSMGWRVFISELVLEEVIKNIQLKIPKALSFFIKYLKENKITVCKNPPDRLLIEYRYLAKFEDLPIIISAIKTKCDYFITGNIKDFDLNLIKKISRIKILNPSNFLKQLHS